MRTFSQFRERYDREKVLRWIGRLWSWVGIGVVCTLVAFAVVMFADKFQHRLLDLIFTGIGCLTLCITILIVAAYSFLGALDVTLHTKRRRFGRILGAWLFNGPFIAGVLIFGYLLFRHVFLPK